MAVDWIRIDVNMFKNPKIMHLRKLPEGNNIVLIWIMLLSVAGRCNDDGAIYLTKKIPYTTKTLADEFGFDENIITIAINALIEFDMIRMDDKYIVISDWGNHQNADGLRNIREKDRLRVEKHRKKQKEQSVKCIEKDSDIESVVNAWNQLAEYGVPTVSKISNTSSRYKMTSARIKEYGINGVIEAIEKIGKSSFLTGKVKAWVIKFDWFIRPDNFAKVLEGYYDDRRGVSNGCTGRNGSKNETDEYAKKFESRINGLPEV